LEDISADSSKRGHRLTNKMQAHAISENALKDEMKINFLANVQWRGFLFLAQ